MSFKNQDKSFQFLKRGVTEEILEFMVVLHEKKHLGQTAKRLNLSIPKASRLLAQAREIFDDPLFLRHGRGLTPTHRATELAMRCARILSDMRALTDVETFDPTKLNRVFRIACLDNALTIVIGPVMKQLFQVAPQLGISFVTHNEHTISALRMGETDFGIFPAVNLPDEFDSLELLQSRYVQVVRRGHPLEAEAGSERIQEKMAAYRRIQIVVHPDTDPIAEGMPGPAHVPHATKDTAIWTESWSGACQLMSQSDFVLALPYRTAYELSRFYPMTVLSEIAAAPLLKPALIWHHRNHYDPAFVWFRSWLKTQMDSLNSGDIQLGPLVRSK